ncbi:hypothetical protein K474DRAFT_1713736 [Panus rudis PR-1116 ss-1]|nr:hypothetical protein K474DRAFT_1713736 [Panus rudis PR-1116 ss-1]
MLPAAYEDVPPSQPPTDPRDVVVVILGARTYSGKYNLQTMPKYIAERPSYSTNPFPIAVWCENHAQADEVLTIVGDLRRFEGEQSAVQVSEQIKVNHRIIQLFQRGSPMPRRQFFAALFTAHKWPTIYFAWPDAYKHLHSHKYTKTVYTHCFIDALLFLVLKPPAARRLQYIWYSLGEDDIVDLSGDWSDSDEAEGGAAVSDILDGLQSVALNADTPTPPASSSTAHTGQLPSQTGQIKDVMQVGASFSAQAKDEHQVDVSEPPPYTVNVSQLSDLSAVAPSATTVHVCVRSPSGEVIARRAHAPTSMVSVPSFGTWGDKIVDAFGWTIPTLFSIQDAFISATALPYKTRREAFTNHMMAIGMAFMEADLMWSVLTALNPDMYRGTCLRPDYDGE